MQTKRPFRLRPLALAGAALLGLTALPDRASALFLFTVAQSGANVVVTGSGTLNTTALTLGNTATQNPEVFPGFSVVYSGPASSAVQNYTGVTVPASFGSGGSTNATSSSGSFVGVVGFISDSIYVPTGYVSGTALADTSTYANTTIATLGFTPGTYTDTWGTGTANADSLVVNVVPEPSTWALLSLGAGLLSLTLRRHANRA